ncbi:uncharacterized protein L203_100288 [Cryptococcus depauperatus CBS 7841]|uniref:GRIP domain-containing protein n=1 Tax=Cryptococcus depauperatus CBS 7841 TaxID=1295531 RepID=A0AAJ8JMS0_9TREE
MFGSSLQDRLKAAVDSLEAAGSSLHARALHANQQPQDQALKEKVDKATGSLDTFGAQKATVVNDVDPSTEEKPSNPQEVFQTKSTASNTYTPTSQLAENALSGLRKSFRSGRLPEDQEDSSKLSSSVTAKGEVLKDTMSPTVMKSEMVSPVPTLLKPSSFALDSEEPFRSASPLPQMSSLSRLAASTSTSIHNTQTPLHLVDSVDPSSIPLPPSPPVSALSTNDPLGVISIDESEIVHEVDFLNDDSLEKTSSRFEIVNNDDNKVKPREENESEDGLDANDVEKQAITMKHRYEDLSQRFTNLLATTHSANQIFMTLTPLESGIKDPVALEGWIRMVVGKVEMMGGEIKRLQDQMALQESRMEELRDTHRLEGTSQQQIISKLRSELSEAQAKVASSTNDSTTITQLRTELSKAQSSAKEEEEKRTKAISLLKTVRLKLVKIEKEKEEVEKDRASERAERTKVLENVESIKAEKEKEVNALRKGFEREIQGVKERWEKDVKEKKSAWELEAITTKAAHAKELSQKHTKIIGLESIVKELNIEKQQLHAQFQIKQAEIDQARADIDDLQTNTRELRFQLKETTERCELLDENLREHGGGRGQASLSLSVPNEETSGSRSPSRSNSFSTTSPAEIQRLLAESELRAEAKLLDMRTRLHHLEAERNTLEEEFNLKLSERVRELEKMRRMIVEKEKEHVESMKKIEERETRLEEGEAKARALEAEMLRIKTKMEEIKNDRAVAAESERTAREEHSSLQTNISALQSKLDESKSHITHLKSVNKTLREEMRKVQSSVQLLERSRNPGVGYWAAKEHYGVTSPPPVNSETATPLIGEKKSLESVRTTAAIEVGSELENAGRDSEEELNLEYLRNVILQFLEHKEMRPNLIRVMSVILRFTPQELRRLNQAV